MTETSLIEYWWLIPLVLIAFCIFGGHGCCAGWRRTSQQRPGKKEGGHDDAALVILNRRFARGEIDEEEFIKKREVLTGAGKGEG